MENTQIIRIVKTSCTFLHLNVEYCIFSAIFYYLVYLFSWILLLYLLVYLSIFQKTKLNIHKGHKMVISFGIKECFSSKGMLPECFSKLVKRSGKLGYHLVRGCKNRYHGFQHSRPTQKHCMQNKKNQPLSIMRDARFKLSQKPILLGCPIIYLFLLLVFILKTEQFFHSNKEIFNFYFY